MIKYAKYAIPYLINTRRRKSSRNLVGLTAAWSLMLLSGIFLSIAGFIWFAQTYGISVAFAVAGGIMLFFAGILFLLLNRKSRAVVIDERVESDPLAKYVPDSLRENPAVQKLLQQIEENPAKATAAAVTVGMLLSREL